MTDDATPSVDDAVRERLTSDPYCEMLGIELREVTPGTATATLTVTDELLNFHGTPHGGAIYSLADAAFAAASNSHGDTAVALETNVSYLETVDVGETLLAVATETHRTRRTGEYEVVVSVEAESEADSGVETDDEADRDGTRIATFRGRVYRP